MFYNVLFHIYFSPYNNILLRLIETLASAHKGGYRGNEVACDGNDPMNN